MEIKKLSPRQSAKIDDFRLSMLEKIRNLGDKGIEIEYLHKKFRVYRNVFWPGEDSIALVNNFIIHPGDTVLDVGTGSGVISIFSAYKGAGKIVAVDINPDAIYTAKINAAIHGFDKVIDIRLSNVFDAIKESEKFDVIVSNPPMSYKRSKDFVESTIYDSDFKFHSTLFEGAINHLKENGRMYLTQSNFGEVDRMLDIAEQTGFNVELLAENIIPNDFRIFYAFKLVRKTKN